MLDLMLHLSTPCLLGDSCWLSAHFSSFKVVHTCCHAGYWHSFGGTSLLKLRWYLQDACCLWMCL